MSDLIRRSALINVLKERATNESIAGYMTAYDVTNSIIDEVEEQPTAYDINKVVEELEEIINPKEMYFCRVSKGSCIHEDDDTACIDCVTEKAIEIVKQGGVRKDVE